MKTEKRIPTPLELLQFAKETGIFERLGVSPDKVGFGNGLSFEKNEAFFIEAYSKWDEWEYSIRHGALAWSRCLASDDKRRPLSQVQKEMAVRDERTMQKYFAGIETIEPWAQARTKGFFPWMVEEMIRVRDGIAKERAKKGATAMHAKAGKKFEQGKSVGHLQQADTAVQQAGQKSGGEAAKHRS